MLSEETEIQNDVKFQETVIIGNETWVDHFDLLINLAENAWKQIDSQPPKEIRQTNSAEKFMITIFVDHKCVIF